MGGLNGAPNAVFLFMMNHQPGKLNIKSGDDGVKGAIIYPNPHQVGAGDEEHLDLWGFSDTVFKVNDRGHVVMTGSRYPLSGQELPDLLPWIRNVMALELNPDDCHPSSYPPKLDDPRINSQFLEDIRFYLTENQISFDPLIRLRHGHGHTQQEMYAIKYGQLKRMPDLVIYPSTEEQVVKLVETAGTHDVCLIPYGGGTSVTQALLCPQNEDRMIVSVDLKRLNRILWIDPVNRMASIQAGAVGRHIVEQLEQHGFTMGHEPDSVEFSTLGGWIATHASGMKKNKYGNIEDLVIDMNVVTPQGLLKRYSLTPRESTGLNPSLMIFGSEGSLGIITQAVVKIFPVPQVVRYGSILFPTFEAGYDFMYELTRTGAPPASVRLVDNLQFQFGLSLKTKAVGLRSIISRFEKFFVTKIKRFNPKKMVAVTLVFEGSKSEVRHQESLVYRIAKKKGGMKAGAENGKRGYQLTFGIAYIRDFVMNHYILAESFETSVPWSQTLPLCQKVKERLVCEHKKRNLPGKPFVTCRITQIYATGVCVYFYFGFYHKGVQNPSFVYHEIEEAAREEILKQGGSLSHHHGIGKLRGHFLKEIKSEAALNWNEKIKQAVDPTNIFGCGNQLLVLKEGDSSDKSSFLPLEVL